MKILYCALKYDYGDPKRGYGSDHYFFYDTLKHMGHKIIYFDIGEESAKHNQSKLNKRLLSLANKNHPDLFFSVLYQDQITPETIKKITQQTTSINWFCDDTKRFDDFSKFYAPSYSWVVTTEPQALTWYKNIGYNNAILSNWAFNQHLFTPARKAQYKYEVTFVGQPNKVRVSLINYLKINGININCWGHGWPDGRLTQKQMYRVFNQSKINLNFTNTFKKKNLLQNWMIKLGILPELTQMKARIFEVPGSKGFLLTQYVSGIEDYYALDKEIVAFKNKTELLEKLRYYLANSKSRQQITISGYKRTLKEHTYQKRFDKIFKKM